MHIFDWLCNIVEDPDAYDHYYKLLEMLHKTRFYILIPNDENRCSDGHELRYEYEENTGDESVDMNAPCSVLEMLIGLARRMDFILANEDGFEHTDYYFWLFIRNLGLDGFDDSIYDLLEGEAWDAVQRFIDREYGYSGAGGLFPLSHPNCDQRDVEIWEQMNRYIYENYPD